MINDNLSAESFDFGSLPSGTREKFLIILALGFVACQRTTTAIVYLASLYYPGQFQYYYDIYLYSVVSLFATVLIIFYIINPFVMRRAFGSGFGLERGSIEYETASSIIDSFPKVRLTRTKDLFEQEAITLGLPFRRIICLGGGLRFVVKRRPDAFIALMSHELAHVKNGDIDISVLSRAIVYSLFFLVLAGPGVAMARFMFEFLRSNPVTEISDLIIVCKGHQTTWMQVADARFIETGLLSIGYGCLSAFFVLMLGWITYLMFLRDREHYADLTGCILAGKARMLELVSGSRLEARSRFGSLIALHPSPERRKKIIENPLLVLSSSMSEAVLTGYLFGLLSQELYAQGYLHQSNDVYQMHQAFQGHSFSGLLTYIVPFIFYLAVLSIVASQSIRYMFIARLSGTDLNAIVVRLTFNITILLVAMELGCLISPKSLEMWQFKGSGGVYMLSFEQFISYEFSMIFSTGLLVIYLGHIYPLMQTDKLGRVVRITLEISWIYVALQISQLLKLAYFTPASNLNGAGRAAYLIDAGILVTVVIAVMGAVAGWTRKYSARPKNMPAN